MLISTGINPCFSNHQGKRSGSNTTALVYKLSSPELPSCQTSRSKLKPPREVAQKIVEVRKSAAFHGRIVRFGIRLHIIVRETADEAWTAADELIQYVTADTISDAQKTFARFDSAGQQRMSRLHDGKRENLEISPNLWARVGLVRG